MIDLKQLAKDIFKFRQTWDLTQSEFARLTGIHQGVISRLEASLYKSLSKKEYDKIMYIMSDKCMIEEVINMKVNKRASILINKRLTRNHKSMILDVMGLQKLKDLKHGRLNLCERNTDVDYLVRISLIKYSEISKIKEKIMQETTLSFESLSEKEITIINNFTKIIREPFDEQYSPIKDLLKELFNNREDIDIIKKFNNVDLLDEWVNKFLT